MTDPEVHAPLDERGVPNASLASEERTGFSAGAGTLWLGFLSDATGIETTSKVSSEPDRYLALDSLRGFCACSVFLYHMQSNAIITNIGLIRNAWMFVDFFFVLSGFVIANAYRKRLAEGYSPWRFLGLRLGRIYPLHFAVLACMVALEVGLALAGSGGHRTAFGPGRTTFELLSSLFLLNCFGLTDHVQWNGPSWTIAAEFWAYCIFALIAKSSGQWWRAAFVVLGLASLVGMLALGRSELKISIDFGLLRCLYGFSVGVLIQPLAIAPRRAWLRGLMAEVATAVLVIGFVSYATGYVTFAAPLIFAIAVCSFARSDGPLSSVLGRRWPVLIGALSYSIYMMQALLMSRVLDIIRVVQRHFAAQWLVASSPGGRPEVLVLPFPLADVVALGLVVVLICFAWLGYQFVELRYRNWSRRLLARRPIEQNVA